MICAQSTAERQQYGIIYAREHIQHSCYIQKTKQRKKKQSKTIREKNCVAYVQQKLCTQVCK